MNVDDDDNDDPRQMMTQGRSEGDGWQNGLQIGRLKAIIDKTLELRWQC